MECFLNKVKSGKFVTLLKLHSMTDVLSINFLETQVSHSPDPRQRRDFVKRLGNIKETFELPQSERRHTEETSYPFPCSELESKRCAKVTALFLIDG